MIPLLIIGVFLILTVIDGNSPIAVFVELLCFLIVAYIEYKKSLK